MYEFALTIEVLGELMIAFAVVRVHHRVLKDHKIDANVFKDIRTEQVVTVVGVLCIVVGYLVKLIQK